MKKATLRWLGCRLFGSNLQSLPRPSAYLTENEMRLCIVSAAGEHKRQLAEGPDGVSLVGDEH
jgi:hypothetical protein